MGHSAKTAEKKEVKKVVKVQRTDEQVIKDIRLNLGAHLSVTPEDIAFLLKKYDLALTKIAELETKLADLKQEHRQVVKDLEAEYEPLPSDAAITRNTMGK
jgi:copper oxidase (laccase) domain-containing protein